STVPFCTASSTCRPGTISPAANTWIWNFPSVASDTYFANSSQVPYRVSSDFGQLAVNRHFKIGDDCAIAGAAIAVADAAHPIAVKIWRRFVCPLLLGTLALRRPPCQGMRPAGAYNDASVQCAQGANGQKCLMLFSLGEPPGLNPRFRSWPQLFPPRR